MQSDNFVSHAMQIVKAVLLSLLFCVAAVLIFALVLHFFNLSDSVIRPVNLCIKALCILFGCFFGLRGEKGWLKGIAVGIIVTMLTYFLFALVGGGLSVTPLILLDLLFGAAAGLLSGIVAVNAHA